MFFILFLSSNECKRGHKQSRVILFLVEMSNCLQVVWVFFTNKQSYLHTKDDMMLVSRHYHDRFTTNKLGLFILSLSRWKITQRHNMHLTINVIIVKSTWKHQMLFLIKIEVIC